CSPSGISPWLETRLDRLPQHHDGVSGRLPPCFSAGHGVRPAVRGVRRGRRGLLGQPVALPRRARLLWHHPHRSHAGWGEVPEHHEGLRDAQPVYSRPHLGVFGERKVPPPDTEPNGRRCPACFSASTAPCREETVNCTESEFQCIESAGTINMGERPFEFTMKGCASASACDQFQMGSGTFLVPYLTLTTAKCTAASSGTNVSLSTPPPSPASRTSRGAGVALGPARLLPALAGLLLWLLS
ncbi:uncharacterized protein LOC142819682, partial [Pelodiscus sinensis]|uniref:uncharacterized protein LOC142819682 n=1 Tax=Pelodiscus sinensis TaxID=13735 RepID=UPI003F6BB345